MRKTLLAAFVALATMAACKSHPNDTPAPDNTAKNSRDRAAPPTVDNAGNGKSDVDLTQQIRKAVMDDGSLSTNAHNCKVVVNDGVVTLTGPVASADERAKVEALASSATGATKVVNQLEGAN